ncbi:hypothetical protein N8I77_007822 [Diaporthe amygdali]|uniref:Uncharacterized protein n=1 Tax=Phomopsis amygdali TaxID=1214568 RepID=A0AAD9SCF1_PHOAM|nr:hypothetical protein N8I77_007822 [Diaporthe amygdali]
MSPARLLSFRPVAAAALRPGRLPVWQVASSITYQRANYSPIPPLDKKNDDLGGPYGQESPNPEHRQKQNRGFAVRTAATIGLAFGVIAVFSVFASPRQIAQHQIENDKVIGAPTSNTGKALADLKRRDGVKTSHQLHQEQSGSSILGTK